MTPIGGMNCRVGMPRAYEHAKAGHVYVSEARGQGRGRGQTLRHRVTALRLGSGEPIARHGPREAP
jgi:hypothetical protein